MKTIIILEHTPYLKKGLKIEVEFTGDKMTKAVARHLIRAMTLKHDLDNKECCRGDNMTEDGEKCLTCGWTI